MENNFYVGIIHHKKRIIRPEYNEKVVLYKLSNERYLDLIKDIEYTTNINEKDYVIEETLIITDITQYRENYLYLLSKHNNNNHSKKRIKLYERK